MTPSRGTDDLIVIWAGDVESLTHFFQWPNNKNRNIQLSFEYHVKTIHFPDLRLELGNHKILTKTFFKPVDGNSYIPVDSCHHGPWLINIPKGQLIRLQRNCSKEEDFYEQAKFIGKYKPRNDKTSHDLPIILNYNVQYKQVESFLRKYWPIFRADIQLCTILPEQPKFTYRRAPMLRDIISKNFTDPPSCPAILLSFREKVFFSVKGVMPIGTPTLTVKKGQTFCFSVTRQEYTIKDFISCRTDGVEYVFQCPCLVQYVWRTKHPTWKRIHEHIQNIHKGFSKHSASRHFAQYRKTLQH